MHWLALFSPHRRLSRGPFAAAAIAIYLLGLGSQTLLTGPVLVRAGIGPFVLLQAVLLWVWYAIHANRLRDTGRGSGLAAGIAAVNVLCILFVLMLVALFTDPSASADSTGSLLGTWIVFLFIVSLLSGAPAFGFLGILLWTFFVIAILPALIAIGFSIRTGVLPSAQAVKS